MDRTPEQIHELIASWDSIKRFVCDNSEATLEEWDAVLFQDTERQSVEALKKRAA